MNSAARLRGQSGASLIEIAIAVMIIGISLLSLVSLLYTIMASSASHRATVRTGDRASEVAEAIDGQLYVACPASANPLVYQSALDTATNRLYDESIVKIEFLQSQAASTPTWGTCPAGGDQGAQRITLEITARSKPTLTSRVVFVKRDTTCPAGLSEGTC